MGVTKSFYMDNETNQKILKLKEILKCELPGFKVNDSLIIQQSINDFYINKTKTNTPL